MVEKVGRNDPCYCGSGLKYKKCHMPADKETERSRTAHAMAVSFLQRDLLVYAREEQFAEAFAVAISHYWNGLYTADNMEEMAENEAFRFFDWFIYDYTHEGVPRLLEQYRAEKWDALSSVQQDILTEWLDAPPAGGYELTGYDGNILHLRDVLTDEAVELYAGNGRGNVSVGEIVLGRPVQMRDRLQFSTTAAYIPLDETGDIVAQILAARDAYLGEHPDADHTQFLRANNVMFIHHALAEAEKAERPPVARLDPDRDDGATRAAARLLARQVARQSRRR